MTPTRAAAAALALSLAACGSDDADSATTAVPATAPADTTPASSPPTEATGAPAAREACRARARSPDPTRSARELLELQGGGRGGDPLLPVLPQDPARRAERGPLLAPRPPDVLLCDEPTGALDAQTGKLVLEVIDRVHREIGTTVIVITHNAGIAGMAHRVIHLADGRVQRIETNARRASASELSW